MNNASASKEQNNLTRQPVVAGIFYPDAASDCRHAVTTLLQQALAPETPIPKALIVPHAGYIYSGAVAAVAYKKLLQHRQRFSRVVLIGPSHRVAFRGVAIPEADVFRTPMGDVALDTAELERLRKFAGVIVSAAAHQHEHSLEVQLPFLQAALDHFSLVPLVAGDTSVATVASIIDYFWHQPQTLIVVSSDLSHYLDYEHARSADRDTAEMIEGLRPGLTGEQACGCNAINGLLQHAALVDAQIECVDLRSSGDTAGDHSRVVGYGAFVVY